MRFKTLIPILISCSFITVGHAKTNNYLISKDVKPKYNLQLSGSYPLIAGNQFKEVNSSIVKFIKTNFDNYPTEVSFEKLYQNKDILSFSINYNISNSTERYFNEYYALSLSSNKKLNLSQYLKDKKISKYNILKNINSFIAPCLTTQKSLPDYCSDMALQNLIGNNKKVNFSDISSFFIKSNDDIGIGIDSNKLTTTFIYNTKTKKVNLNYKLTSQNLCPYLS